MIYICTNTDCYIDRLSCALPSNTTLHCTACSTCMESYVRDFPEMEDLSAEELREIEIEEQAAADFERAAYGEPTAEEGGIRNCTFDTISYNEAGEPNGYC